MVTKFSLSLSVLPSIINTFRWDPLTGGSAWARGELEMAREEAVAVEIAAAPHAEATAIDSASSSYHGTTAADGVAARRRERAAAAAAAAEDDDEGDDEAAAAVLARDHTASAINALREHGTVPYLREVLAVAPAFTSEHAGGAPSRTDGHRFLVASLRCCLNADQKVRF